MLNKINQLIQEKQEYKEQMARVKNLPDDYRFVFEKLQNYMWRFAGSDGCIMQVKSTSCCELKIQSLSEKINLRSRKCVF